MWMLFIIIVLAIITALALWNYPREIYRIVDRIAIGLFIIAVVYYIVLPMFNGGGWK